MRKRPLIGSIAVVVAALPIVWSSAALAADPPAAAPPAAGAPAPPPPGYAPPPPGYGPPPPGYGYGPPPEAEKLPPKKNVAIVTNMLNLAIGAFGVEVGIALADFVSLNVNALYWKFTLNGGTTEERVSTLTGGGIGAQFFPSSGRTFKGFYIYPSAIYLATKTTENFGTAGVAEGKSGITGFGSTFGYQWLWDFGLVMRVGGGLTYYTETAQATATSGGSNVTVNASVSGTLPNIDAHIGYAF